MYEYKDGCSVQLTSSDKLIVKIHNESIEFDKTDKEFDNNLGETVLEYSGLSVGDNSERSWAKASYKPAAYSELHFHDERTEDYYIVSGHAKVILDGGEHHLFPGDHIQIPPRQQHQVFNESTQEELTLVVKCAPAWIRDDFHLVQNNTMRKTF